MSQAPYVHPDPDARQLRREYIAEVTEFARRHQPLPEYADVWGGGHRLDELRVSDILVLQRESVGSALRRANNRHAGEGCIRAMRLLYRLAVANGLLSSTINPAAAVARSP